MTAARTMTVVCCVLLAGCAGQRHYAPSAARAPAACPSGTVKYCESLFEKPGTGLQGCACAELMGRR